MSHYIRTIHTPFTSPHLSASSPWPSTSTPYATTSASAHANILLNLGGIMNTKYPPGLGHSDWHNNASAGASSLSSTSLSLNPSPSSSPYTKRRNAISLRAPPSRRPAPPPPVYRAHPASVSQLKFDPFSDENAEPSPAPSSSLSLSAAPTPVLYRTPRPYTIQIPPAAQKQHYHHHQQEQDYQEQPPRLLSAPGDRDRDARSRLVAGILLNRVHAVGRPMRGRRTGAGPRQYVRSGLSSVVCVEA